MAPTPVDEVAPFISASGHLLASSPALSCPPIDVFFGGGVGPWTLFTVNASLVTTLPLSISSQAIIKQIRTTDDHAMALFTESSDARAPGMNVSFMVADSEGKTALSQWHLIEDAREGACAPTLSNLFSKGLGTFLYFVPILILLYLSTHVYAAYKRSQRKARQHAASAAEEGVRMEPRNPRVDESGAETDGEGEGETTGLLPPPYKADGDEEEEDEEGR